MSPSAAARRSAQSLRYKFAFLETQHYTRGRQAEGGTHIGSQRTSNELLIVYTLMSGMDDFIAFFPFCLVILSDRHMVVRWCLTISILGAGRRVSARVLPGRREFSGGYGGFRPASSAWTWMLADCLYLSHSRKTLHIAYRKLKPNAIDMTSSRVPPQGIWAPAVTFYQDDELDLASQAKYYKYLSQHLTGLVILGTNAETFLLTREERAALLKTARKAVGPEYPIMAGVSGHSTKQVLEFIQDAYEAKADYALVLPCR